jgi:succinyl-diaminopimelate desuccinylase
MATLPKPTPQFTEPVLDTDALQDEMAMFTEQLVAVPTENPPGKAYGECVAIIRRKCIDLGMQCEVISMQPSPSEELRHAVVAYYGSGKPVFYFHGHYDVVPANDPAQFQPRRRGTKIFGRGSADMKGGLAAMLGAIRLLQTSRRRLKGRIGFVAVPDEETGGKWGSQYLSEVGVLGQDAVGMLTAEPTGGVIWNASRGAISLRVKVKGRAAHVGLHYMGVNAFEQMHKVTAALLKLKSEIERRKTSFSDGPDRTRSSILMLGGICSGGTNFNSLPGECTFTIDRRINPEEDLATEKKRLLSVLEDLRRSEIEIETEILQEGAASGVPASNPVAQALTSSIESITGKAPRFEMCPGLLETRFYAQRGVPAFAYGPGLLSVSHGPHEFVELKDMMRCASVYAMTAARVLG